MKYAIRLLLLGVAFTSALPQTPQTAKGDAEIKREIIRESVASYRGNCPCPYNVDRAGRSCGRRSAYSRPGGASPICYPEDVTPKMVEDYRKKTQR